MNNEHEKCDLVTSPKPNAALAETEKDCRRVSVLEYFGEPDVSETCVKLWTTVLNDDNKNPIWPFPAKSSLLRALETGQRFGAGHIIDVLARFKMLQKVLQNQNITILSTMNWVAS